MGRGIGRWWGSALVIGWLIGAGTSLFTGRNAVLTSLRSLFLGFTAAAITYGVGRLLGVTLS